MRWEPGEVVVWRETWRDRTYFAWPVRVVEDTNRHLAVYVAGGTPFHFPPGGWPFEGEHPYHARDAWTGHGVLVIHRQGTAHAIWHFWEGPERRFQGWYVNLQDPFRRDRRGFDTQDHELDLWIEPNGEWEWKDQDRMQGWICQGRWTAQEVEEMRAEGERVLAEWPFPTGWEDWMPDSSWPVPELPAGWARE